MAAVVIGVWLLAACSQPLPLTIDDLRWELTEVEPVNEKEVRVSYVVENEGDGAGVVQCRVTAVDDGQFPASASRYIQIGPYAVWEESGVLESQPKGLNGEPPDLDCRLDQ